jgi:hypothetical protein
MFSEHTEFPYDFYEAPWCNNTEGKGFDLSPVPDNIKGVDLVRSPMEVSIPVPNVFSTRLESGKTEFLVLKTSRKNKFSYSNT